MQPYSIIAALELLVTFEVMTQVPQRDEVMAAVNRLFGFFLLLFIDLYFFFKERHFKENGFVGERLLITSNDHSSR